MNPHTSFSEKGQSLAIIALGLVAFVAMLALVLDGANAYAAKRQAQNAADAGALAGANIMCKTLDESQGKAAAVEYVNLNGGTANPDTDIVAELHLPNPIVQVTATVTKNTFFAGVIGFEQVKPRAFAEAKCFNPGADVLPVAWSCRESVVGGLDCSPEIGPCKDAADPNGLDCTYIVMDSVKVKKSGGPGCNTDDPPPECFEENDVHCAPPRADLGCVFSPPEPSPTDPPLTYIDCDLNNDCADELKTGGARAWLDLDGRDPGSGASELRSWITGADTPPTTEVHTWLPSEGAVQTSIFRDAKNSIVGTDVILPVFDKTCENSGSQPFTFSNPETVAQCNYGSPDILTLAEPNWLNYHIISFSAFHVTCIQTSKNKAYDEINGNVSGCPGHDYAVGNTFTDPITGNQVSSIEDNDKTIEGYFTVLYLGGYGGPGSWIFSTAFTVALTQ